MLLSKPLPLTRMEDALVKADIRRLTHRAASCIADFVLSNPTKRMTAIDLSQVEDATTSAYARLVLLRRMLLAAGRDLRLRGLRGRAARLYEIERLHRILPRG